MNQGFMKFKSQMNDTRAIAFRLILIALAGLGNLNSKEASGQNSLSLFQRVDDKKGELPEISGIDRSLNFPGLFWVHNDSGNKPIIFGIAASGQVVTKIIVSGKSIDWEDITTGSCGVKNCIYIADFGNNLYTRNEYELIVLHEPETLNTEYKVNALRLKFQYPDLGAYNSEALAFNELDKRLYSIRKTSDTQNTFYRFPANLTDGMKLESICDLKAMGNELVTGADISSDGKMMIVKTKKGIYKYHSTKSDLSDLCDMEIKPNSYKSEGYSSDDNEAVAFTENDQGFISIPEGRNPSIFEIRFSK